MNLRTKSLWSNLPGVFAIAGFAALFSGCETVRDISVTAKLWDTQDFSKTSSPATPANLAVSASDSNGKLLVRYDEYSEAGEKVRPRAYWLADNRERIRSGKPPHFVEIGPGTGLHPLLACTNTVECTNRATFATTAYSVAPNGRSFVLCRPGLVDGPFDLPVYNESNGTTTKVILTPLAVTGDAVMFGIGGIFIAGYLWIVSGAPH